MELYPKLVVMMRQILKQVCVNLLRLRRPVQSWGEVGQIFLRVCMSNFRAENDAVLRSMDTEHASALPRNNVGRTMFCFYLTI